MAITPTNSLLAALSSIASDGVRPRPVPEAPRPSAAPAQARPLAGPSQSAAPDPSRPLPRGSLVDIVI